MSYKETKQLEELADYVERLKRAQEGDSQALETYDYSEDERLLIMGGIKLRDNVIMNLEKILNMDI
jgi:hypothetical protein